MLNSSFGVSRVSVTGISFEEGSGVAHFLQNSESEVFSALHLGHFISIVPSACWAKGYQFIFKESISVVYELDESFVLKRSLSYLSPSERPLFLTLPIFIFLLQCVLYLSLKDRP
ncbi:hypothetical protein ES703_42502 [subsurface metagenome]